MESDRRGELVDSEWEFPIYCQPASQLPAWGAGLGSSVWDRTPVGEQLGVVDCIAFGEGFA
jgi:hypothetical protein